MTAEYIVAGWREVRAGLMEEATQIPADQFSFQAAENSRSVKGILQHLVESQKMLVGEVCRPDTNLLRGSFADQIQTYAPDVRKVNDKDGLLKLLQDTMHESEEKLLAAGDALNATMKRFDGKETTKISLMSFAIAHEMYHRGQLTVYERLLGIEPALTQRFRKAFGASPP